MESSPQSSSPFDFDDDDLQGAVRARVLSKNGPLRWCVIFAVGSFLVALIASVVENNANGNPGLESTAHALNRSGMVGMLLGCIGIFFAFRSPTMFTPKLNSARKETKWPVWWFLFASNLVVVPIVIALVFLLAFLTQGVGMVFIAYLVPILFSLMLVTSIYQQGIIRAYAIGFLVIMVHSLLLLAPFAWMASSELFSGYNPYYYGDRSLFGGRNQQVLLATISIGLLLSTASGLLCSGYVALLERINLSRRDHASTAAELLAEDLQLP